MADDRPRRDTEPTAFNLPDPAEQHIMSTAAMKMVGTLLLSKVDPALLGVSTGKLTEFLTHVGSSAPRLKAEDGTPLLRWQDRVIKSIIPEGASVLDLGCGGGELLARLIQEKGVRGQGLELDPEAVFECVERGVPVFQVDLNEGLRGFPDDSFDFVVLEETLQTLVHPREMLDEMLRVGRRGIVSFPNFGYWRIRLDLATRGRMPVSEWLPHRWYDSPNIHLFTLQDFLDWCHETGATVVDGRVLSEGEVRPMGVGDNLYAEEALAVVERP